MSAVLDYRFIANPHALLTDGVVTDVVYMQDYDAEQIKETLAKYSYDEVIALSDYGDSILVGDVRIGDKIVPPPTYGENQKVSECLPCQEEKKTNNYNSEVMYSMEEKV